MKITNDEGKEIEVYTAEEAQAKITEAVTTEVTKVKKEFEPIKAELESKLGDATKALGERTSEFRNFRKLSDDVVAKLGVAERTIYENQKLMADEKEKRETSEKTARENLVNTTIRAKVGKDDKAFEKVKGMYSILGIEANTPEEIEKKTLAALGALQTSEPDALASISGFSSGGGWKPPETKPDGDKTFADSDKGKSMASELGLMTEPPKKK